MSLARRNLDRSLRSLARNLRKHRSRIMQKRRAIKVGSVTVNRTVIGPVSTVEEPSLGSTPPAPNGTVNGPVSSLLSIPVPASNPFLVEAEKASMGERVKRGRLEPEAAIQVQLLVPGPPTPLQKARDCQVYDTGIETALEESVVRAIATNLYVRYHYVDDSTVSQFLIPKRLVYRSEKKRSLHEMLVNDANRYQTRIMAFYFAGVKATVDSMGGEQIWSNATESERLHTFARIFDAAALDMATAALGPAASAIPLHDIFSDVTEEHQKWQRFHRMVFATACEDTFTLRVASAVDQRKLCFSRWKGMMTNARFSSLQLGGINDIPFKWGSLLARRRQPLRVPPQLLPQAATITH